MLLGILLSISAGLMEAAVALILQLLLRVFGLSGNVGGPDWLSKYNTISSVLFLLTFAFLIKSALSMLSSQCMVYSNEQFNCSFKNLAAFEFLFTKQKSKTMASDLLFRFQESIPKTVASLALLIQIVASLFQLTVILISMFLLLPQETLMTLIGLSVLAIGINLLSKRMSPISKRVVENSHAYNRLIQRAIPNKMFFEILKTSEFEYRRMAHSMGSLSAAVVHAGILSSLSSAFPTVFGTILISSVIFYSSEVLGQSGIVLMSFLYLLMRMVQIVSGLGGLFSTLRNYSNQISSSVLFLNQLHSADFEYWLRLREEYFDFWGREYIAMPIPSVRQAKLVGKKQPSQLPGGVEISNLSFKYAESDHYIFEGLNLTIPPGSQLGVVGKSGSGKSTLLKILMGVEKPSSGSINIDGVALGDFLSNLSNRIGYVGVEPFLFYGTLRENVTYGVGRAVEDDEIFQVFRRLKLGSFANKERLDAVIGEDLSGLSAGQKQRVCLARALLNDPIILILDEATANLDLETEEAIATDLFDLKGKITTIIVAHRHGIIKNADKVLSIES
jgi:ABC-type multidrug transport system fused ATPase/permease subunit